MRFVGLDVHRRVVQAVILDASGRAIHTERFEATREELLRFARERLGQDSRLVLEATCNTWPIVDLLQPHVAELVVSNPLRTRAIAEARVKTDKVDARVLAELLRVDYLPRVWQPDPHTQARRRIATRRASLVGDRTRIKNRIHAILHQRLVRAPADLFGTKGLAWLRALDLDPAGRTALESELDLLAHVEHEIDAIARELVVDGYADPQIHLLLTLPGVDVTVAHCLIATLGDIHRFRDPDHAASYVGLVPSTRQSADRCYHGPITKQGRAHARWLLVQAAHHLARHPGPLGVFFRRLAKKKTYNIAVVATARKLVTIAWHMLKNNEPYRYAQPTPTARKLLQLRTRATGERRRAPSSKGQPRSAAYGTGNHTRRVAPLAEVYASEGLPQLQPPTDAEQRVLEQTGTAQYVATLAESHRELRVKGIRKKRSSKLSA